MTQRSVNREELESGFIVVGVHISRLPRHFWQSQVSGSYYEMYRGKFAYVGECRGRVNFYVHIGNAAEVLEHKRSKPPAVFSVRDDKTKWGNLRIRALAPDESVLDAVGDSIREQLVLDGGMPTHKQRMRD